GSTCSCRPAPRNRRASPRACPSIPRTRDRAAARRDRSDPRSPAPDQTGVAPATFASSVPPNAATADLQNTTPRGRPGRSPRPCASTAALRRPTSPDRRRKRPPHGAVLPLQTPTVRRYTVWASGLLLWVG